MNRAERRKAKKKILNNLTPVSPEGRTRLRQAIDWQTNDELIQNLKRLHLQTPFVDEVQRARDHKSPLYLSPLRDIEGCFKSEEEMSRAAAMAMLWSACRLCKPAIDALNMSKRVFFLADWPIDKFRYDDLGEDKPSGILRMIYDIREKKGF